VLRAILTTRYIADSLLPSLFKAKSAAMFTFVHQYSKWRIHTSRLDLLHLNGSSTYLQCTLTLGIVRRNERSLPHPLRPWRGPKELVVCGRSLEAVA